MLLLHYHHALNMQTLRMSVNLFGLPARVMERALEQGFAGSRTDVLRAALIAYGEKYRLMDSDGILKTEVKNSLYEAAQSEGLSTADMKRRLKRHEP